MKFQLFLTLIVTLLFLRLSSAQTFEPKKKKVLAYKLEKETEYLIDGNLNETFWNKTQKATNFIMQTPDNGKPINQDFHTEVMVAYNDYALIIGARLYDQEPEKILSQFTERDIFGANDAFGVHINGYNDGQENYEFFVTASGGQIDRIDENNQQTNLNWDAIWKSAVTHFDKGWNIEIQIPYAALRFAQKDKQIWGINFTRELRRFNQIFSWNHIDNSITSATQQNGELHNLNNITPPTRLFLIPYTSTYSTRYAKKNSFEYQYKAGMDLKYGLNDAFTLDAILIPDFGQTSFDEIKLNLTPFEQLFKENRPFFTEANKLFSKDNLVYTRRIGSPKIYSPNLKPYEKIISKHTTTDILNAVKFSGRTKKGLGIGVLNALTDQTKGEVFNFIENSSREVILSPLTNYNALILDQRFGTNSSISFANTNVLRSGHYNDVNVTGILFDCSNKKNSYAIRGNTKLSQNLSTTNQTGTNSSLSIHKTSGRFLASLESEYNSKNYNQNDFGFQWYNNYHRFSGSLKYRILKPTKKLYSFDLGISPLIERHNASGEIQRNFINLTSTFTNKKLAFFYHSIKLQPFKNYDYFEARAPGYYIINPTTIELATAYYSNTNKQLFFDIYGKFSRSLLDKRSIYLLGIKPSWRVSNHLNINLGTNATFFHNNLGWADFYQNQIIFTQRNRFVLENSLSSRYAFSSKANLELSLRHYWAYAENMKFFTLEEAGLITPNYDYDLNRNTNFNIWNFDLSFSWWIAPGSQLVALYRNFAMSKNKMIEKSYIQNFSNLINNELNHSLSISLRYFIDYNLAKKWLK